MIRPSSLKIGRYCSLAPHLSERYPETSDAANYGNLVDGQFTAAMMTGVVPSNPDALACVEWVERNLHAKGYQLRIHQKVRLFDEDTGGLLTEGTPDVVAVKDDLVVVVDLKKREQYWTGRLDEIDGDLQTHAYALATCQEVGATRYCKIYLLFGDGEVDAKISKDFGEADWPPILQEIRELELRAVVATRGTHCMSCYPRQHCPAWLLPPEAAETSLAPLTKPGGITQDNAGPVLELVLRVKDMADQAEKQLRDFARKNGGIVHGERKYAPVLMPGRRSANVAALEAAGLTEYVTQGAPFEQFRWLRAR